MKDDFMQLQAKIEEAEKRGESIVPFVKAQIRLLEKAHDEFISRTVAEGYSLSDYRVGEIEIQQLTAMGQLALKIGKSTEPYDTRIKNIQIRIFGEENYKRFFTDG